MRRIKHCFIGATLTFAVLLAGPLLLAACAGFQDSGSWRTADRSSAGLAPTPEQEQGAVVQVYGARAYNWRGYFSVHTWISTKEAGANTYYVHQVTGWRHYVIQSRPDDPDRNWYGAKPALIADFRGQQAERIIGQLGGVIENYPYPTTYEAWPGPNSNTFVAWVIRQIPEMDVALPSNAIGKDYLGNGLISEVPGGAGYQLSLGGYFGVLAGVREGLELNILGLSLGINPLALGIKLPGIGELALRNTNPMPEPAATKTDGAGTVSQKTL
ncbi:DUF3750 domain-containing protein [Marinobacter vulgaris]|uniref:DUF3750 domain-containing protein n=1 Tax=Marinobacter vulgaris TaxID=1928331 RepID=A0A2V3ZHR0_9GAMM|nr:DUF3750 domain-containing protein [Marinobacter vulgaris]PXX89687.1 DUF3750 domain-containing protein [Marinobacter vulgaris]TSJ68676.1 DUF3750 domain-containing protein [Marinobacter vulgaris]